MYFMCKAVDMAPQPIRCLWSGDNKHLKKKKKKKSISILFALDDHFRCSKTKYAKSTTIDEPLNTSCTLRSIITCWLYLLLSVLIVQRSRSHFNLQFCAVIWIRISDCHNTGIYSDNVIEIITYLFNSVKYNLYSNNKNKNKKKKSKKHVIMYCRLKDDQTNFYLFYKLQYWMKHNSEIKHDNINHYEYNDTR